MRTKTALDDTQDYGNASIAVSNYLRQIYHDVLIMQEIFEHYAEAEDYQDFGMVDDGDGSIYELDENHNYVRDENGNAIPAKWVDMNEVFEVMMEMVNGLEVYSDFVLRRVPQFKRAVNSRDNGEWVDRYGNNTKEY